MSNMNSYLEVEIMANDNPTVRYQLLNKDELMYMVQYIFLKLKGSPLNVNSTYAISRDDVNQLIVLTDDQGVTTSISYADFGEENILEGVQIDGTDLTITNKKVNIPMAGAGIKGVTTTEAINALIQAALENRDTVKFIKVANFEALPAEYDNTKTYAVGDYCKHSGVVYMCTTAIDPAEEWTPAHWDDIISIYGAIFLVPNGGVVPNIYDEYIWTVIDTTTTPVTYGYEKIGTTEVDLSGYVRHVDIHLLTNQEVTNIVDDAYDAVFNPTTP